MLEQSTAGFSNRSEIDSRTHLLHLWNNQCAVQFVIRLCGRQHFGLLLVLLVAILKGSLLFAQTKPFANLQLGHDSWTSKDGVPGAVGALAQTADGFLWLGTPSGLFRFDGTRFERFSSPFGDQLLATKIISLLAPASGGLWVGYASGGMSFLKNGKLTNYGGEMVSSTGTVGGFAEDHDGFVWAVTAKGLFRFDHSSWQPIGADWNIPAGFVLEVGCDGNGILWLLVIGAHDNMTLSYLLPGSRHFRTTNIDPAVGGLTLGPDGKVFTSAASKRLILHTGGNFDDGPSAYPVFGTNCYQVVDRTGSVWSSFATDPVLLRSPAPGTSRAVSRTGSRTEIETYKVNPYSFAKLVDHESNIWFGTEMGLHRFFYSPIISQELPGASAGTAFSVAAEEHGAVWISFFSRGYTHVYRVEGSKIERQKSIPASSLFLYRAPDNTLWFDGKNGVWHLTHDNLKRIELPREVRTQAVGLRTITQDRTGALWVSLTGPGLYRLANGVWTPYGGYDDLPRGRVLAEFTDNLGRVWFGYDNNVLAALDHNRIQVFRVKDGLKIGNITAIYGRGEDVWIGGDLGLQRYEHGRFKSIKAVDDEWLRGITGMTETANGDLWLNAIRGIFHVQSSEISLALGNPEHQVNGDHFGSRDGLPGSTFQVSRPNTVIEGPDGRIWFAGVHDIVWMAPAQKIDKTPPTITVQSISADDKFYSPASSVILPKHTSSVQISYASVSLSEPNAIRFRYKLQEIDQGWHEVAQTNTVSYRNLGPGLYHFMVASTDANGAWADKTADVEFTILPAFYQTRWFLFLCASAFVGLCWIVVQLRLGHMAVIIKQRAEARAEERVRIARDLHDTLLQGIQGLTLHFHVAAQELPEGSKTRTSMERALVTADRILVEGRNRVTRLRADDLTRNDLVDAFEAVAADLNHEQQVRFALKIEGCVADVSSPVLHELYYIGREAISNAFRHAHATEISVNLNCGEKSVALVVSDNGCGFDLATQEANPRTEHWGLVGMKERAEAVGARFECHSLKNSGTEVVVTLQGRRAYQKNSGADQV